MGTIDLKPGVKNEKRAWHSPKVEALGNLRDFVKSGNAFGKSIADDRRRIDGRK